jgi:hypothetical protein
VTAAAPAGVAYRLAALEEHANGGYNIAAGPVLDQATLARVLRARRVHAPARALRVLIDLSGRAPAGLETPLLAPGAGGPLRIRELLTGVGPPGVTNASPGRG